MRRRDFLGCGACLAGASLLPRLAFAALPTDRRFVLVILRGGLDGLHAIAPVGDKDYVSARGGLALPASGEGAAIPLDGFFALNPALAALKPLWDARQMAAIHAVASPYRERSHFDGQNLLELGGARPHDRADGWLNRALGLYGAAGGRLGLAIATAAPLVMQGTAPVATWAPSGAGDLPDSLLGKLQQIYGHDSAFSAAFAEALQIDSIVDESGAQAQMGQQMAQAGNGGKMRAQVAAGASRAAGKLLLQEPGPRLMVMEYGGWDTHAGQAGQLNQRLSGLAEGLAALADTLAPVWSKTAILVVTEFGRTVRMNGTGGTDHGTAGLALALGGAIKGGRVLGQWPGLATDRLYQGRDLNPTTDLRSVAKALLRDHLGLPTAELDSVVFPDSTAARALEGLVA